MTLLLGLDIGTSSIKGLAYDPDAGRVVSRASRPTPVTLVPGALSEHDPEELWSACAEVFRRVSERIDPREVSALALASFGDTGIPLDSSGEPLYPMMTSYARRCSPQVTWLAQQLSAQEYRSITGKRFSTSLGVSKWLWISQHVERARREAATWLSASDYILWRLTGRCATDYSVPSRTGLFDQTRFDWSDPLLALVGLERGKLPQPLPSATQIGGVTREAARKTGLVEGTPCSTGGHDDLCAMLLAGQDLPHTLVDSTGTDQSLLLALDHFSAQEELGQAGYTCYAHVLPGRFVVRGGLRAAGGAIDWYVKGLLDIPESELRARYGELACTAAGHTGGLVRPMWLPYLLGSGTPHYDPASLAAVVGLRAEHGQADVFGGLIESLTFWLR